MVSSDLVLMTQKEFEPHHSSLAFIELKPPSLPLWLKMQNGLGTSLRLQGDLSAILTSDQGLGMNARDAWGWGGT